MGGRGLVLGAAVAVALVACTNAPKTPLSDSAPVGAQTTDRAHACHEYGESATRTIRQWYALQDISIDFLPEFVGPTRSRWTVRWHCKSDRLFLELRLPEDDTTYNNVAEAALWDLERRFYDDGLDPRADKQWVHVLALETGDVATFDPRRPLAKHPPRD
jgi:hypothetical protein